MKKYIPTQTEVYIHSQVEGLPKDLVDKIFSIRKKGYRSFIQRIFGVKEDVHLSKSEYMLLLQGARIAYQNQSLMGRALPKEHHLTKDVENALHNLGVCIQYHPEHGLQIIEKL